MKAGSKTQLGILTMLIILVVVYRMELAIGGLYIYSLTGSPHAERVIGEVHSELARQNIEKAALHYQKAMYRYKMALPLSPPDQKRWLELLIGHQYECGRGVDQDVEIARLWYEKSAEKGLQSGQENLKRLNEALNKIHEAKQSQQPQTEEQS